MAKLIYSAITSLDGYVADEEGNFDWSAPDEEVHSFVNELERPVGTYLYGRRMYEVMSYWETADAADFIRACSSSRCRAMSRARSSRSSSSAICRNSTPHCAACRLQCKRVTSSG